ncbi:MAG: type II secretion system F family protein [Rhizobiaceae bacterium]
MNFSYRSISSSGGQHNGAIEASTRQEALRKLAADGRTVFELIELKANADAARGEKRVRFAFGARKADLARMFNDLAMLTGAGLTVTQALHTMRTSGLNAAQNNAADLVATEMSAGRPAADAFSKLGTVAVDALAMIASGENAGSLPNVFAHIASRMEDRAKMRTMVLNALAYPAFLITLMAAALGVVTFALVPSIEPVFANSGKPPPFAIEAFAALRGILEQGAPFAVLAACGAAIALLFPSVRKTLASRMESAALRLPLVGRAMRSDGLSRYLTSLSMLLENGAPMAQSLLMSAQSAAYPSLRKCLMKARDDVSAGQRLPQALKDTGLFDGQTLSLIAVGYDAGRLPQMAARAAGLIDAASRERLNRFLAILTPALTIVMGLVIGGLVVSVMAALLAINELAIQ